MYFRATGAELKAHANEGSVVAKRAFMCWGWESRGHTPPDTKLEMP